MFVGPNLLSFILAIFFACATWRIAATASIKSRQTPWEARSDSPAKSATKPTDGRTSTRNNNVTSTGSSPQSLASASRALTAVCLALVNVMFNLADGVLGPSTPEYYVQSQYLHPVYETHFWMAYLLLVQKRRKPLRPGHLRVAHTRISQRVLLSLLSDENDVSSRVQLDQCSKAKSTDLSWSKLDYRRYLKFEQHPPLWSENSRW